MMKRIKIKKLLKRVMSKYSIKLHNIFGKKDFIKKRKLFQPNYLFQMK